MDGEVLSFIWRKGLPTGGKYLLQIEGAKTLMSLEKLLSKPNDINRIKMIQMSDELKELQKITRILTLANADSLSQALSEYASTDERKMIWVLIDGVQMPKDMAKKIGKITVRAVTSFLKELETARLIENPKRKPPTRLIDIVPSEWIDLLKTKTTPKVKKE